MSIKHQRELYKLNGWRFYGLCVDSQKIVLRELVQLQIKRKHRQRRK